MVSRSLSAVPEPSLLKKPVALLGLALLVLGLAVSYVQLTISHSAFVLGYYVLPYIASGVVFQELVPPLPDLHRLGRQHGGAPVDQFSMAELGALCMRTVVFRAAEGTYYSTLLPIWFQEVRTTESSAASSGTSRQEGTLPSPHPDLHPLIPGPLHILRPDDVRASGALHLRG